LAAFAVLILMFTSCLVAGAANLAFLFEFKTILSYGFLLAGLS
jgi:hypothetical protein